MVEIIVKEPKRNTKQLEKILRVHQLLSKYAHEIWQWEIQ
jgi:hypothetical protein